MTDRPILFSAPMIRAMLREIELHGTGNTQTRRLIGKTAAKNALALFGPSFLLLPGNVDLIGYTPGDRLWVREAWNCFAFSEDGDNAWPTSRIPTKAEYLDLKAAAYRVDIQPVYRESERAAKWFSDQPWRPGIHMPRWASRLTLLVEDVRVQRLQDISEDDARAEGIERLTSGRGYYDPTLSHGAVHAGRWCHTAKLGFGLLWDSLNKDRGDWVSNPWVVAVTFKPVLCNIDRVQPRQRIGEDSQ